MAKHDLHPTGIGPQTPTAIAAQLDQDRAALAQSIEALRDRLTPNVVLEDALDYARANVGPYAQALEGAVRANPMAAILVGAGVAWLALGRRSAPEPAAAVMGSDWMTHADRLRDVAILELDEIDHETAHPAEVASHRAGVLSSLATATRAAMLRGLDGLSHEAQDSILAARESAYAARIAVARQAGRVIEDRPLLAAGIGMAIGAAVGAALPGTATEDRLLGPDRDRLLAQAKGLLREEQDKVARAGVNLAATLASDMVLSARKDRTEKV
jgi:ElaB/YqjD/DUF883 family membrane-anchored ribosome-binding protein